MKINDVINEQLIKLDLDAYNRNEVILELAELMFAEGAINNIESFVDSVNDRERLASTYSGNGVAVPHGISKSVQKACICFGRAKHIDWDDTGDTPVKFVFLIAVPDTGDFNDKDNHLNILSDIAVAALREDLRKQWAVLETPEDFIKTLEIIV